MEIAQKPYTNRTNAVEILQKSCRNLVEILKESHRKSYITICDSLLINMLEHWMSIKTNPMELSATPGNH